MVFFLLFLFLLYKFYYDKSIIKISIFFYFLGLVIIMVNVFWVNHFSDSYFEGSDATGYYISAKEIKNNFTILNFIDVRYIGYNLYQIVVSFPYFNNELIASLLIKMSSWSLFFISLNSLRKSLLYNFYVIIQNYRFNYYSIIIIGLWLSLYNFRDIIILICLFFISSGFIGSSPIRLIKVLFFLFILFYFRFFYVVLLFISYFLAIGLEYIWRKNFFYLRKTNLLLLSIIIITFLLLSINSIDILNDILLDSENVLQSQMFYEVNVSSPVFSILQGMFAGNSLDFLSKYFFMGFVRAFTLTPISAVLMSLIYFYSYLFFLQMFVVIFNFRFSYLVPSICEGSIMEFFTKKMLIFLITSVFFVLFTIIIYSTYMEGLQERIRATLLPILIIVITIFAPFLKSKFNIARLVAIFLTIVIFILYLF